MKKNASQMPISFLSMRRDLEQDNGHSSDLVLKRSGVLSVKISPQGEWDNMAEKMMLEFAEKRTPSIPSHESIVLRSTQKQRPWKIVDTLFSRFGND